MRRTVLLVSLLLAAVAAGASVASSQVTVSNSATLLSKNDPTVRSSREPFAAVLINQGSVSVFLGPSGVTSSTGLELKAAAGITVVLNAGESLYGVTASSTARVDVLESQK